MAVSYAKKCRGAHIYGGCEWQRSAHVHGVRSAAGRSASQHVGRRWQAIVKRDGRTWHRTGGTKAAVEAWAKAIEKDLDAGLDPDRVKTGMPTLAGWEARCRRPNRGRCS
jgi:hypothetical protein